MLRGLGQATLIVLLGVAPLLLLEGALRLAGWPTQRVRTLGKLINLDPDVFDSTIGMFKPNVASRVAWPPELAYGVRTNSLGLRGTEIEREPKPGRVRILAIGDSQTFGFYLAEGETWPVRLEEGLRRKGLDVEVVNAGVGGYTISSQTQFVEERGLKLEPDIVVLAFVANDIRELERPTPVYEGQKQELGEGKGAFRLALYQTALYELYLRAQVRWKRFRRGTPRVPLTSSSVPAERLPALWAEYASWLDRLDALLRERGVTLAIVYVPDADKLSGRVAPDDESRLRELAAERGILFTSPLDAFKLHRPEEVFLLPLDGHLRGHGAQLVADAVASMLIDGVQELRLAVASGSGERVGASE